MFSDVLVLNRVISDLEECVGSIQISDDASLFGEHFPNNAILPGAFSLIAAYKLINDFFYEYQCQYYKLIKINKVDFVSPIKPGSCLSMNLKQLRNFGTEKNVSFIISDNEGEIFLKGRLVIEGIK